MENGSKTEAQHSKKGHVVYEELRLKFNGPGATPNYNKNLYSDKHKNGS